MPFTFNGIGTHYYGAKNRSSRVDQCEFCGKETTLSSYETREFFCVLFIPLIPVGKYQILNDCRSCRRHQRISARDFRDQLDAAINPLREMIRRNPRDPAAYVDLVSTLMQWELRGEAERELQDAMGLFPQNTDLLLLNAQLEADRNAWEKALSLYERAGRTDPSNTTATYGQGWMLHHLNRHQEAVALLQRAANQDFNRVGALYLLGLSQMKLDQWNDALNSFHQLIGLEPQWGESKDLLRLMRECKTNLGWELTDAERRAGRRWFSGRKKKKRVALQTPTMVRPGLRVAGIALVLFIGAAFAVVAWDEKKNITLYVDNGLDRPVRVELDGQTLEMTRKSMRKEALKPGQHTVIVREKDGREIERHAFRLEERSLLDVAFHDEFYVYNVAGENVYRRAVHGYATDANDSTYDENLIALQRFFQMRDVDYAFQTPPSTIQVQNRYGVVKKVSFTRAEDLDLATYAIMRLQEGKADEARSAIDQAALNKPCDTSTRQQQVQLASLGGAFDLASATAQRWMADCSDNLEAHRSYQDVNRDAGRHAALRAEYRARLERDRSSAAAHYLYARVLADSGQAIAEYRRALELDPSLAWARIALGHSYGEVDRYEDAFRELTNALDLKDSDPAVVIYYAMAAIANGTPEKAIERVDQFLRDKPNDYAAAEARWLLAVATSDWDKAKEIEKLLRDAEGPGASWWRDLRAKRIKGESVHAELDRVMDNAGRRGAAIVMQADELITAGKYSDSADLIEKNAKELDGITAALRLSVAAGGLLTRGTTAEANELLNKAVIVLEAAPEGSEKRVAHNVIEGLRGTRSPKDVLEATREESAVQYGWFVAGVRAAVRKDRDAAAEALRRCVRHASDLDFPYLEAKAIAQSLKNPA